MRRVKGLNRRIFKRNLMEVLNYNAKSAIKCKAIFELWVDDYIKHCEINGVWSGWYTVDRYYTISGHSEEIRTN